MNNPKNLQVPQIPRWSPDEDDREETNNTKSLNKLLPVGNSANNRSTNTQPRNKNRIFQFIVIAILIGGIYTIKSSIDQRKSEDSNTNIYPSQTAQPAHTINSSVVDNTQERTPLIENANSYDNNATQTDTIKSESAENDLSQENFQSPDLSKSNLDRVRQLEQVKTQEKITVIQEAVAPSDISPTQSSPNYSVGSNNSAEIIITHDAQTNTPIIPTDNQTTVGTEVSNDNQTSPSNASDPSAKQQRGWSKAKEGVLIGAATGGVIGPIISKKKGKGAVIGAIIGAAGGYIIGHSQDKKDARQ